MSITASEARDRLFPLMKEVNEDQTAVEIVSRGVTAYLVPADEYESLVETAYLLRSPRNAARLHASLEAVRSGRTIKRELLDAGELPIEEGAIELEESTVASH